MRTPKVVEIGFLPLLSSEYPDAVTFIDTKFTYSDRRGYAKKPGGVLTRLLVLSRNLIKLLYIGCRGNYDAVVVRCLGPENSEGSLIRYYLKKSMGRLLTLLTLFACRNKVLAVIDMTDHRTVHPRDLSLLDRCSLYFKRELADNIWGSLEACLPKGRCLGAGSSMESLRKTASKFRSISLGIEDSELNPAEAEKEWDVFYIGGNYGLIPSRLKAESTMRQLEERGFRIKFPQERLPNEEFKEIVKRSWLCLSPGGVGWDCYRHYEVAALGSCPVITPPSILAHAPYEDGVSAFVLQMNSDWPSRIAEILKDKESIRNASRNALSHVAQNHTFSSLARYIMREITISIEQTAASNH